MHHFQHIRSPRRCDKHTPGGVSETFVISLNRVPAAGPRYQSDKLRLHTRRIKKKIICDMCSNGCHITPHTQTHTAAHGSLRCSTQREFLCSASATSLRMGMRTRLSDVDTEKPTGNIWKRTGLKYKETAAVNGKKLSATLITASQYWLMNNNHREKPGLLILTRPAGDTWHLIMMSLWWLLRGVK